jgi:hypothetical protein
MRVAGALDQAPDKSADGLGAVPADDVGRNLVTDEVAEYAGVALTVAHSGGYRFPNLGLGRCIIEKRDMLRPGESDENL